MPDALKIVISTVNDWFSSVSQSKNWGLRTKAIALAIAIGTFPILGLGLTADYLANRSTNAKVLEARIDKAIALSNQINLLVV